MKANQVIRVVWYDTQGLEIYKTTCSTYKDALRIAQNDLPTLAGNYTIGGVHLFVIDNN